MKTYIIPITLIIYIVFSSFAQPDAQNYYESGLKNLKSNDFIKAIGDFTSAISINPKFGDAYYQRALAKDLMGKKMGFVNSELCYDLVQAMKFGNKEAASLLEKTCMGECFNLQNAYVEPEMVLCADFSSKVINTMPSGTESMMNLIKINLFNNKLLKFPESLTKCDGLLQLDISSNKMVEISPNIKYLTFLNEINLNKNQLTTLPYEFGDLKNLKSLYIRGNLLKEMPKSIAKLTSLENLDLSLNGLTSMPIEISNLKRLKTLSLVGNPISKKEQKLIQALLPTCKIFFDE